MPRAKKKAIPKAPPAAPAEATAPVRPPGANITVARRFMLAHHSLDASYDFVVRGDAVEVVHIRGPRRDTYMVPLDEARELWHRLRTKGFERF